MSHENQTIRQQFLAVACQYLFGRNALCAGPLHHLRLQPIPVRPQPRSR